MLILSMLLFAGLAMINAPLSVILVFIIILLIPSFALALYGLEIGIIPRLNMKIRVYIRASFIAFVTLILGLGIVIAYTSLIISDIGFLVKVYYIKLELTKVTLPG